MSAIFWQRFRHTKEVCRTGGLIVNEPIACVPAFETTMKLPQIFASSTSVQAFAKGDVIFKQGDPAGEMFVVESGEVNIVKDGKIVETISTDGFFGEMSLIDDTARSADAVAHTDCRLLTVNRRRFLFMVEEVPLFALHVMKGMADRLRKVAV